MKKKIFILNGKPGSGKDTFAKLLEEHCSVFHYSMVSQVKKIAKVCGWRGGKTDKDRKFLSDLKDLLSEYNDLPYNHVKQIINMFHNNSIGKYDVLVIDVRDPEDIYRLKDEFDCKSILIKNDRVNNIIGNHADDKVFDAWYDHLVCNNGTLDDFSSVVKIFYEKYIKGGN